MTQLFFISDEVKPYISNILQKFPNIESEISNIGILNRDKNLTLFHVSLKGDVEDINQINRLYNQYVDYKRRLKKYNSELKKVGFFKKFF